MARAAKKAAVLGADTAACAAAGVGADAAAGAGAGSAQVSVFPVPLPLLAAKLLWFAPVQLLNTWPLTMRLLDAVLACSLSRT
ncbi:hypothetical protein ACO0LF_04785 [Undibacterium sp. Di27W]|uniref:hypothetical protein n=1 Tax=Undibacterium sp. Di27W TaxID=3413036 RepID=UPI003BF37D60